MGDSARSACKLWWFDQLDWPDWPNWTYWLGRLTGQAAVAATESGHAERVVPLHSRFSYQRSAQMSPL